MTQFSPNHSHLRSHITHNINRISHHTLCHTSYGDFPWQARHLYSFSVWSSTEQYFAVHSCSIFRGRHHISTLVTTCHHITSHFHLTTPHHVIFTSPPPTRYGNTARHHQNATTRRRLARTNPSVWASHWLVALRIL